MDATLVLTRHDVIAVPVDLERLKKLYPHKIPKLVGLSICQQVKVLHRKFLREYPDPRIDAICFLGFDGSNALYFSAYMAPAYDFWAKAIVVTENQLLRFHKTLKIRTEVLGKESQIIALVIRNSHLEKIDISYDETVIPNRLSL